MRSLLVLVLFVLSLAGCTNKTKLDGKSADSASMCGDSCEEVSLSKDATATDAAADATKTTD